METKKRLFFPLLLTCLGLILCASLATAFLSLSKIDKTDSSITLSTESFNIYILEIGSSKLEAEAVQKGKDSMQDNNAGYVWEKDKFYVLSGIYLNENDAVLVKKQRKNSGQYAEIIKETFPSINISSVYSEKEREVLIKALNSFYNTYLQLFDMSVSIDGKYLNETSVILKINEIKSNFNTIRSNFETLFKGEDNVFIKTVGAYLIDEEESLDLLAQKQYIIPLQTLSSLIKYRYCECLHIYKNLLSEIMLEK